MNPASTHGAWAVVPVKSFARAKSRLAVALSDDRRIEVARTMAEHVLRTALACPALTGVLVATDGNDVAGLCAPEGPLQRGHHASTAPALALARDRDEEAGRLGSIVDRALATLTERGATAALVLMSDLPHLGPDDLDALLTALERTDLAVAPDRADHGTNALALRLPCRMPTVFGHAGSFARHLSHARRHGLATTVIRRPALAHDIDAASDL